MTDYTAIFEAGESVAELFRREMTPEPIEKKEQIGLCEPQLPEDFRLTVWIYNMEEQRDGLISEGFRPDPEDPASERFTPMRLKLHLLISAHSKAPAIRKYSEEYRIIGRAMQTVRDNPYLPPEVLYGALSGQTEPISLELIRLDPEQLSQIWNNTQKTISPSFGVDVSQVFIRSGRTKAVPPRAVSVEYEVRDKKSVEKRR